MSKEYKLPDTSCHKFENRRLAWRTTGVAMTTMPSAEFEEATAARCEMC
jgi:hypothetical protein